MPRVEEIQTLPSPDLSPGVPGEGEERSGQRKQARRLRSPLVNRLIAIGFVLTISLPLLGMPRHWDLAPARNENRAMASLPMLSANLKVLADYPAKFISYFNDHFAFRNVLIRLHGFLKLRLFGVPSNDQVIVGRNGWLFLAENDESTGYRVLNPFTGDELARWHSVLQFRHDWLARRGIAFIFVIPPDKQTIYPEYMSPSMTRLHPQSRLDQLIAYTNTHGDVRILDLRPALLAAKAHERVYQLTDSHWNERGAFVAYQQIMSAVKDLFPQVQPLSRSDVEPSEELGYGGDLTWLLGINDLLHEDRLFLRPRVKPFFTQTGTDPGGRIVADQHNPNLPTLVMIRDSFANSLIPFMANHFGRAVYASDDDFSYALIESEKPQLVIHEIVERKLTWPIPDK